MLRLKRSLLVMVVCTGLLGISSMAMAEHDESHPEDTLFSFGYDSLNHFLAINIGPNDTLYECWFENGTLDATYGNADAEGVIPVDTLEDAEGVKTFEPREQEKLAEGLTEASEPVLYTGAAGECGVSGVVVAGPNGQINHGQFMKAAKSLLNMKGHGCVVRYLAQSDIGRTDDTKVRTSEADPGFTINASGQIDFSTFEADCSRGKKDKGAEANAAKQGRNGSPGKSGSAPGKNK